MKPLSEYINKESFDYLDNIVIEHCNIAYAFRKEGINELFTFESLGLYKGCREIVDYIMSNIKELYKNKSNTIKYEDIDGINNHYFDELKLVFTDEKKDKEPHGEYEIGYIEDEKNDIYEKSRWDVDRQVFNFIKITMYNFSLSNENDIAEILTHELVHSWDDYILHVKSYSSLRDRKISSNNIENEFKKIKRNLKDNKVMCLLSFDFDKMEEYNNKLKTFSFVENLIYYLDKFEINAYIAQINQILRGKHFSDVNDAVKCIIDESPSYSNYKCIYDLAYANDGNVFLEHGANKQQLAKIQKLASKAWRKIVNHTYHICVDYVERKLNEGSSRIKIKQQMTKMWER